MDQKRANLVSLIQQALAASREVDDPMTEYLLDTALSQALEKERGEITAIRHPSVPLMPRRH